MKRKLNADGTTVDSPLTRLGTFLHGPSWAARTLRGVGGAVLFIVLSGLITAAIIFVVTRLSGWHEPDHAAQTAADFKPIYVNDACLAAGALLATYLMSRLSRRAWLGYGLQETHPLRRLLHGMACGLVYVVVLMASIAALHGAHFGSTHVSSAVLLRNAVLWAGAFACVAVAEETLFRGYAFFTLGRNLHPVFAAVLLSLVFGAVHLGNGGETLMAALFATAYGLTASLGVWRSGSLWWVFGLHAAFDWSETCLFGVADSGQTATHTLLNSTLTGPVWLTGGSAGVEGSMLNIPLICVLAWYAWRRLSPPAGQPIRQE